MRNEVPKPIRALKEALRRGGLVRRMTVEGLDVVSAREYLVELDALGLGAEMTRQGDRWIVAVNLRGR